MPAATPNRLANYFAESTYLQTDVATGVTRNRAGTRICTLTSDFMLGLRNAMIHECGQASDEVFRTCGRRWGKQVASRFRAEMSQYYGRPLEELSMATFTASLIQLFSHHGWGLLRLDYALYDKGILVVGITNAIYSSLVSSTEGIAEPLMAGMLAGLFSEISGEDLDCVQTQVAKQSGEESRFVVSLAARLMDAHQWLEQGKGHDAIVLELAHVHATDT